MAVGWMSVVAPCLVVVDVCSELGFFIGLVAVCVR